MREKDAGGARGFQRIGTGREGLKMSDLAVMLPLMVGLIIGNCMGSRLWSSALERSLFQIVALVAYWAALQWRPR